MAPIKFNNQDLLSKVRLEVINPLVDSYGVLTLDVSQLRGNVAGLSKRLGFIEPQVDANSKNLTALNQFARAVAQQVTMTYDKSRVDNADKRIIFTTVGGVESTLDLKPMFIDPVQTTIDVSQDDETPIPANQLDFVGNVQVSKDPENEKKVHIHIPPLQAKLGSKESGVNKIEVTGSTGSSSIVGETLKIDISESLGGGLFVDPSPAVVGKNIFKGDSKTDAETRRDQYFTQEDKDFQTYVENQFKMIIIEWSSGSSSEKQFQCYIKSLSEWVNPFDLTFEEFALGSHSIDELQDGNRVKVLEDSVVKTLTAVGKGESILGSRTGPDIKIKKLESLSSDLKIISNPNVDSEISFKTNPHWRGYYESTTAASTDIPLADRVINKTTIIAKNPESEHSVHVWDGDKWDDKRITEHAFISENGTDWMTLEGLAPGKDVSFTKVTNPLGGYHHKINALPTLSGKIDGGVEEKIHYIEVSNQFARLSSGVLKLPVISAITRNSGDMGQISNIKQGSNIVFDREFNGVLTINAEIPDPIKVRTPTIGNQILHTINDPSKHSYISDGVYTPHHIGYLDAAGSLGGYINNIKAGDNVTLTPDLNGVVTISATGGGGGTPVVKDIQAAVGSSETYSPITKIHDTSEFSEISNGKLTIHSIDCKNMSGAELGKVKTIKAGSNITFVYSTDSATKGELTISSTGGGSGGTPLQAKVSSGTNPNEFLPITKIELVSDPGKSEIVGETSSGEYTMKFDTRATMLSVSTYNLLESTYPATKHAHRFCFVDDTLDMYYSEGIRWGIATYSGMAAQTKSLAERYPEGQSGLGKYDPTEVRSGFIYVTKDNCPLPVAFRETGIVENIAISKFKRMQMFWGMDTGNIWSRIMDPTVTGGGEESNFLDWKLLNGLGDEYFSILTVPSKKLGTGKEEIKGTKPLEWLVIQDPKCNVSVSGSDLTKFEINREGVYNITVCCHITADPETGNEAFTVGSKYEYILIDGDTGTEISRVSTTANVKPPIIDPHRGLYPAVRLTFRDIRVGKTNSYKIKVSSTRYPHLTNVYLDSYKNYVVVQPVTSETQQGVVIADNLRTTLGGFSCKTGYEVHVEAMPYSSKSVRVLGALVNNNLVTH